MKTPDFINDFRQNGVITGNRETGRKILAWLLVGFLVILALAILVWIAIVGTRKPIIYSCAVDPLLGVQTVDLCNIVPQGVRERGNVVVTAGFSKYPGIIRVKGINITYYNVLTPEEQLNTLVKTPAPIWFFQKFGFFWGLLGGAVLVPVLYGVFHLIKKLMQERTRALARQGRIQQRESPEGRTLDLETA